MERVLGEILKPPAVFMDVGANIGFVSLLACSASSRTGRIVAHCFEPDPGVFTWLSRNRELNCDRFDLVINPCAVGASAGQGELTISARPGWSTMVTEPQGGFTFLPKKDKVTVPLISLDEYCREYKLSPTAI
jgi:FkbM family methyltransferase